MTKEIDLKSLIRVSQKYKLLANPITAKIIRLLLENEPLNVQSIEKHISLSQPTTSHYLSMMRYMGFVKSDKSGRMIFYSLNKEHIETLLSFVGK